MLVNYPLLTGGFAPAKVLTGIGAGAIMVRGWMMFRDPGLSVLAWEKPNLF